MDVEALRGRDIGPNTLQSVLRTGTMGTVFLAQRRWPPRQVAVKVFLRASTLEIQEQFEFLEIFRREIPLPASLEHPSIVPIYEHGDVDGLAYLVMPYVVSETLEDILARQQILPLPEVASYLEQIATALDYAHGEGVIHRDLKPANILITPEKKVMLVDFHLTNMVSEGKISQMRLSKPGLLDYMAPEMVIGKNVDGRADLYSLGALAYHMVTGTPPFRGQTLMKVATKHLKMPPPPPRTLRPELPIDVEQVILKALAKDPAERFDKAADISLLFRQAIGMFTIAVPPQITGEHPLSPSPLPSDSQNVDPGERAFTPGMLFGSRWRTSALTAISSGESYRSTDSMPLRNEDGLDALPSNSSLTSFGASDAFAALPETRASESTQKRKSINPVTPIEPTATMPGFPATGNVTRVLTNSEGSHEETGVTGTFKLTGSAKIVSIPVAGRPGQFVTGILPTAPTRPLASSQEQTPQAPVKHPLLQRLKVPAFVLAALIIVMGSFTFLSIHNASNHPALKTTIVTPNVAATSTAQVQATLNANVILDDPLSQNIRNWPVTSSGSILYQFVNGTYHIANNDSTKIAPAILPGEILNQPFVYSLKMQEIHGDDTSINNEFGMILRFDSQTKGKKQLVSFYTFEVLNRKDGEYQFWKYDNSQGGTASPWKELAHRAFGHEFHEGHGPNSANTFKIRVNGKNFTLIVNNKQVWTVQDGSFSSGQVGMLVNLKGTEVAFSDLMLTNN